jgi:hypothetical protein
MKLSSVTRRRPRYADVAATLALVSAVSGTAYAATVLPAKSVGTVQLKNKAVTTAKLGTDSVGAFKLQDGAVIATKLAPNSVTAGKLAPGAIVKGDLAANSVTGATIASGSVKLSDIDGIDETGAITFTVPANSCSKIAYGVSGAKLGQAAFVTFTGNIAPSPKIVFGPLKVESTKLVSNNACNFSSATITETGIGVRLVTFS